MLPILLGASVGYSDKLRPVMIAAGFVLSFSAVALLLNAIAFCSGWMRSDEKRYQSRNAAATSS